MKFVEGSELATAEDTQKVLQERIEFQQICWLGKKKECPRIIIARFLCYGNRERIIHEAFKLKDTEYKIYEDILQELLDERKKPPVFGQLAPNL